MFLQEFPITIAIGESSLYVVSTRTTEKLDYSALWSVGNRLCVVGHSYWNLALRRQPNSKAMHSAVTPKHTQSHLKRLTSCVRRRASESTHL
jgi:hypothetical protein